jgi:hypothetical protein
LLKSKCWILFSGRRASAGMLLTEAAKPRDTLSFSSECPTYERETGWRIVCISVKCFISGYKKKKRPNIEVEWMSLLLGGCHSCLVDVTPASRLANAGFG